MPSQADLDSLNRLSRDPGVVGKVKTPPQVPEEVMKRFPEMRKWQQDFNKYMVEAIALAIKGAP